jgi:hypothetical protein
MTLTLKINFTPILTIDTSTLSDMRCLDLNIECLDINKERLDLNIERLDIKMAPSEMPDNNLLPLFAPENQ